MARRVLVGALNLLLFCGVLFGAAGTLRWPRGWAFLVMIVGLSAAASVWLWRFDKGLFAERAASPFGRGQRPRDRRIVLALMALTGAWFVLMPMDAVRFGWSRAPAWTFPVGAILILATFAGVIWVMSENRFASVQVKLQPDRGQRVIDTGPYRLVRHPMYASAIGLYLGAPLMLGSWWGLAFVAPVMAIYGARAVAEEDLLRGSLSGYEDYTRRVRWRLLPGVW